MNEEGFEEWDADFLDQLIQVEELVLSTSIPNPNPNPNPSQPTAATSNFPPPQSIYNNEITYSPPRELSQRTPSCDSLEIQRLKSELGRVSKQLTQLERECFELRKERDKKELQFKSVLSLNKENDADYHYPKSRNLGRENGVHNLEHQTVSRELQNAKGSDDRFSSRIDIGTSTCKAIGVQTDKTSASSHSSLNDDLHTSDGLSEKLLAIWGSPSDQKLGRDLIPRLFAACPSDLHVLFGSLGKNTSSKMLGSLADGSSFDTALQFCKQSVRTSETAKISHLYSVLTKVSNGVLQVEALFEPLLDLCCLENVVIVHRSLRVLHVTLKHLFSMERKSEQRDNVTIEGLCSRNDTVDSHGSESARNRGLFCVNRADTCQAGCIPLGIKSSDEIGGKGQWNHGTAISSFSVDWVSFFQAMCRIAMGNTEEHVRLESVSIMNAILMRSNAYMDRDKFGQTQVFGSLSQLLKKEAGLRVQKQAVHLLYLLLNCPKLLIIFCSGCKEERESAGASNDNAQTASNIPTFSIILEGVADCVACSGNGFQGLQLRRNAIIVLAFLASSGTSGFEILSIHKLSTEANFLMLILQVLVSEMDIEAASCAEPEIYKARTLLIREGLILLNRLVSSPAYSSTVLRVLTNSRDMASLTVDIAVRLSRKDQKQGQSDSMTRQIRESEIVDLARVFKKRVFTYLGDNIS